MAEVEMTNDGDLHEQRNNNDDDELASIRRRYLIGACLWYFICGIEYSLILSSLEQYASNVDDSGLFGWCLAVFSLSGLLFAPVFGRLTDRLKSIKLSLLVGATCSVLGNVIYALVPRLEFLIIGRFIAGIGNAVDGSVLGYSGQVNTKTTRGATFALLLITKQLGTISVPIWQILLQKLYFKMAPLESPFVADSISSEAFYGLFIGFAWFVYFISCFFFLRNESRLLQGEKGKSEEEVAPINSAAAQAAGATSNETSSSIIPEYVNEPFAVALITTFAAIILQASMEAMGPPFYKSYFGWTKKENGLVFMVVALCAVLGYGCMKYVSSEVKQADGSMKQRAEIRTTYQLGSVICFIVSIFCSILISTASFRSLFLYIGIFLTIVIFCFTLPVLMISCAAIVARNTPTTHQSSAQSVRFLFEASAHVLAPIWVNSLQPRSTSNGMNGILIMAPANIIFALALVTGYSSREFI